MKEKVKELEELYNGLSDLTPEKMESLITESIQTFEQILGKINSGSEEEKKEALAHAEKLRDTLEKQAEAAMEKVQISNDELETFVSNPDNFTEEEWASISKARSELADYQKDLMKKNGKEEGEKPKKKKNKPMWVAG